MLRLKITTDSVQLKSQHVRGLFPIDHIEGSQLVVDDAGNGPSMFGINQAANPDVDVPHPTRVRAIALDKAARMPSLPRSGSSSIPA